jgi:hypothetical protein
MFVSSMTVSILTRQQTTDKTADSYRRQEVGKRGKGTASRMFSMFVSSITSRSKPMPNPTHQVVSV